MEDLLEEQDNPEEEYQKLSEIQHVLEKPGMYMGAMTPETKMVKIIDLSQKNPIGVSPVKEESAPIEENNNNEDREEELPHQKAIIKSFNIIDKEIVTVDGLERTILEPLSNAGDNAIKSRERGIPVGIVNVTIQDRSISIYNEGRPISCAMHSAYKQYIPEFIFSDLRSGSNFNKKEQKKWAGTHGLGVKLTNIFSHELSIDILNLTEGIRYRQTFRKNLSERDNPIIENVPKTADVEFWRNMGYTDIPSVSYTKVTFRPDFKHFFAQRDMEIVHIRRLQKKPDGTKTLIEGEPMTKNPLHCKQCWIHNNGDESYGRFTADFIAMMARTCLDFAFNSNITINFRYIPDQEMLGKWMKWETQQAKIKASELIPGELIKSEPPCPAFMEEKHITFDNNSPLDFAKIYLPDLVHIKTPPIIYEDNDTRLVLLDTPFNGEIIAFANGMPTREGGVHVNEWVNKIAQPVKEQIERVNGVKITVADIRRHITIILSVYVPDPQFATQTKERLMSPTPFANVTKEMTDAFATWQAADALRKSMEQRKKNKIAKATDGKKSSYVDVKNLDDAIWAGTDNSNLCTLYIVEGLSAKPFFTKGLKHMGKESRNTNGCLPVRGKMLNSRKANVDQIVKNKVLNDIKITLGLKENANYAEPKARNSLRYGKLRIAADADPDGSHIKGLIINYLDSFKGLLESGFVEAIISPVIICTKTKQRLIFYSMAEYEKWKMKTPNSDMWELEYFKGLGSSEESTIKDVFTSNTVQRFSCNDEDKDVLELAFGNNTAEARRQLYRMLVTLGHENRLDAIKISRVEDLIYEELILFAIMANRRHIPLLSDGLKDSFRRVVYTARKAKAKFQGMEEFQAEVKKVTKYRHGPESLRNVVRSLSMGFPGSNNIPILINKGNVGSRIGLGEDASAPRYLECKPSPILDYIFIKDDDVLLESDVENGKETCVKTFYPIILLALVNGCDGMGWGWSTECPPYNPMKLIEFQKYFIQFVKDGKPDSQFNPPALIPWWRGYDGEVYRKVQGGKVMNRGAFEDRVNACYILELPIKMSGQKYEEGLKKMVKSGRIKEYKKIDTDENKPQYRLTGYGESFKTHHELHLESQICETNMTFMDDKNIPHSFAYGAPQVCAQFCKIRYQKYIERKQRIIPKLEEELKILQLRLDFVEDVIAERVVLRNVAKSVIRAYMDEKGYPKDFLKMSLMSITKEKADELRKEMAEKQKSVEDYRQIHPGDLWNRELDALAAKLEEMYPKQWTMAPGYGRVRRFGEK